MLRVTTFDESAGIVVGELSFRVTTQSNRASYGRTAKLEDGVFRATMLPTLLHSP